MKPENRKLYPPNWKQISADARERAGNRCQWEGCGLAHLSWAVRHPDGSADSLLGQPFDRDLYEVDGSRVIRVVLTTAHLDHDPANCAQGNLRCWCQYHHLRYDAKHHAETARKTRDTSALRVQPVLFEEATR